MFYNQSFFPLSKMLIPTPLLEILLTHPETVTAYSSPLFPIPSVAPWQNEYAHGLAGVPKYLWLNIVCTAADANTGYAAGQVIGTITIYDTSTGDSGYALYADATNIYFASDDFIVGNEATFRLRAADGTSNLNPSSFGNFSIQVGAIYF